MKMTSKYNKLYNIFKQLFFCMIIPVLFNIAAILGPYSKKPESFHQMLLPGVLFLFFIIFGVLSFAFKKRSAKVDNSENENIEIISSVKDNNIFGRLDRKELIFLLVLLFICILVRIPMIGTMQRWDSGEYFFKTGNACLEYDYTIGNFLYNYAVCYHNNYAYTALNSIILFLFPRSVVAYTSLQIFLSVLAIAAIFRMLIGIWKMDPVKAFVGTLVISFIPIFYGLDAYNTTDYYLILFFIYAMYFGYKKQSIIEAFMMSMMCLTKENAALMVFGYYGVRIIYEFIKTKGTIAQKIKAELRRDSIWIAISTAAVFLSVFFLSSGNWLTNTGQGPGVYSYYGGSVVLYYAYIRIKQHFFTNFTWLITIVSIISMIAIVFGAIKNHKNKKLNKSDAEDESSLNSSEGEDKIQTSEIDISTSYLLALMGAMTLNGLFNIFYPIAALERYDTYFVVCLVLYTVILFDKVTRSKKALKIVYSVVLLIITVIFFAETFVTFDPLTKRWFRQLDTGDGKTINFESMPTSTYYGEGLVTNYQYSWLDKAFDKMLEKTEYDDSKSIFIPYNETLPQNAIHFKGNGLNYKIGWDDDAKKRYYYNPIYETEYNDLNFYPIDDSTCYFPYKDVFFGGRMMKRRYRNSGVFTSVPYRESDVDLCMDRLGERYYIGEEQKNSNFGGSLNYYYAYLKDRYKDSVSIPEIISMRDNGYVSDDYDLDIAKDYINGNCDYIENEIDQVYKYRVGSAIGIHTSNLEGRTSIQPLDSLYLNLDLRDENGNQIMYLESTNITVGDYGVIDEINEALLDMHLGESRTVEYTVPHHSLGLEAYEGQTLSVTIEPIYINCEYEIVASEGSQESMYKESFNEVTFYYEEVYYKDMIYNQIQNMASVNTETPKFKRKLKKIDDYFNEYFEDHGMTEDQFLSDYMKISKEDFEYGKTVLAASYSNLDTAAQNFKNVRKKLLHK